MNRDGRADVLLVGATNWLLFGQQGGGYIGIPTVHKDSKSISLPFIQ